MHRHLLSVALSVTTTPTLPYLMKLISNIEVVQ